MEKPVRHPGGRVVATDALMQVAMKKQEIAKAVAISRAADFRGNEALLPGQIAPAFTGLPQEEG